MTEPAPTPSPPAPPATTPPPTGAHPTEAYPPTPRTTATRDRGRMHYDRAAIHNVLDEAYTCHLAFVVDGAPRLLPTMHVRRGDTVYLHGSTGSRPMLDARSGGLPVCLAVTLLDGLVLARAQVHHSANYRSVVVHGTAVPVTDPTEKQHALDALLDKIAPGRAADSRPPTPKESAETAVLALPLQECSLRTRTGTVQEDDADDHLPHWAGVVPLRTVTSPPEPAPGVTAPPPAYLPTLS